MSILIKNKTTYTNKSFKDFNKLDNNKINEEVKSVIS